MMNTFRSGVEIMRAENLLKSDSLDEEMIRLEDEEDLDILKLADDIRVSRRLVQESLGGLQDTRYDSKFLE